MAAYIARRLLLVVPTVLGISLVSFFLIHLAPGDPATAILGVLATPQMLANFRAQYHLDQPVIVQYVEWRGGLATGNLGYSVVSPVTVISLLARQFTPTVLLTASAMLIAVPVALMTGIVSARSRGRAADSVSRAVWLFGLSMPSFWLGMLLILLFGVFWRVLPVGGYVAIDKDPIGALRSLILPALTLAIPIAAVISRITRTSILEVLASDYVRTAESKGIRESVVMTRHVLRNSLIPAVTTIGLQVGYLLGGAIVVENVFNIPGLGLLLTFSVANRDYGVIQGIVLLGAIVVMATQLLTDLAVARLDPRVTVS
jgi:peptide/nickel transport system permease protein